MEAISSRIKLISVLEGGRERSFSEGGPNTRRPFTSDGSFWVVVVVAAIGEGDSLYDMYVQL